MSIFMSYFLTSMHIYLSNGYMPALASSYLVWYDVGQAMPTHNYHDRAPLVPPVACLPIAVLRNT